MFAMTGGELFLSPVFLHKSHASPPQRPPSLLLNNQPPHDVQIGRDLAACLLRVTSNPLRSSTERNQFMPTDLPTLYPSIRTYNNMQQPAQHDKPTIEMSLREHLLAAGAGQPTPQPLTPQHGHPGGPHAIDPAIAGPQYQMSPEGDGHMSEGRKGRRELSTSKRAAQNRAAQRAFRQRKEEYIKQLKDQVKEFEQLCEMYKTLQTENYQLRDYIINLQSRLLETQGEVPPAPAGVDLSRSHHEQQAQPQAHPPTEPHHQRSPSATGGLSERQIGELQMAAQAANVVHQSPSMDHGKHPNDESTFMTEAEAYAEKRQKVDSETPATGGAGNDIPNGLP